MQFNKLPQQKVHVHQLVMKLLDSYEEKLANNNISLEIDVEKVRATVDHELIESATQSLVDNAIDSMPEGGELSVTLIDGMHQWELEVADTSSQWNETHPESTTGTIQRPKNEHLNRAYRDATAHGGEIQTWNCPLGGVAHVLAIPRIRINSEFIKNDNQANQSEAK